MNFCLQPITNFNQKSQVKKTNDASLAPFAYQSVQAGASRGGGPLLWAVRPEASVEHIRNTTSGPSHSCGLRLATALKDLQLQKTRHPVVMDLNGFGCRKRRKHAVLLRLCESFAPHYQRDCVLRRSEATMLKGDSTKSYGQRYL